MADPRTVLAAELFKRAVDRPLDQRSAFLNEACGDDVELRREVESLLKFNEDGNQFLEEPAIDIAVESLLQTSLKPDQRIGNYKVVSHIGSGGMGDIFRGVDRETGQPLENGEGQIILSATWGLGSSIAQGEIVPDRIVLSRTGFLRSNDAGRKVVGQTMRAQLQANGDL